MKMNASPNKESKYRKRKKKFKKRKRETIKKLIENRIRWTLVDNSE